MAKKKKKSRVLLLLVVAMILMSVGYVTLLKVNDKKEAKKSAAEEEKAISLSSVDQAKASKISYKNQYGEMTLVKEDKAWKNEADSAFPVNQTYAQAMLAALKEIKATKLIRKDVKDLGEYGLDNPVLTATLYTTDNKTVKIFLGSEVPIEGGYYAVMDGGTTVYAVGAGIFTSFNYSQKQMIAIEKTPVITASNITHLKVENKNGKDFEIQQGDKEDESVEYNVWSIVKPYKTAVKADTNSVTTLMDKYTSFTYKECANYNCSDFSKYGLSKPAASIDVKYYETKPKANKEYQLFIGDKDNTGNYYVKTNNSKAVYLMDAPAVEGMINVKPFDAVYKTICEDSLEDVKSIDLNANGTDSHMTVNETTKKDKKNKESKEYTFLINGKQVQDEKFRKAFAGITSLKMDAEITKKVSDNTPLITLVINGKYKNTTLKFLPYNDDKHYRLNVNGEQYFLITKRTVDDMVKGFNIK